MKNVILALSLCIVFSLQINGLNNRPVIGVMTQGYVGSIKPSYNYSYIAASYVKYLESAGARVVPIHVNQTESYYVNMFNWTNGILFPGGGEPFQDPTSDYGRAGKIFFRLAKEANDRGEFYPLWGTCLGFQLLNYLAAGNKTFLKSCSAKDMASPVQFTSTAARDSSRLFGKMDRDVLEYLQKLPVTVYYHQWCLTQENYTLSGLDKFFKVLSLHQDKYNMSYIATIEAIDYPFYGTAYHPEKNQFEFVLKPNKQENIPHTYEAVRVGQAFANFFVQEARKSNHQFPDLKSEQSSLIYNYQSVYTELKKSNFEEIYFFHL